MPQWGISKDKVASRKEGRLYPSVIARLKILYRCKKCGDDIIRRELRPFQDDLFHGDGDPPCGPVAFMKNPKYRKP